MLTHLRRDALTINRYIMHRQDSEKQAKINIGRPHSFAHLDALLGDADKG